MGVPTIEKAPGGLKDPWLGIWRYGLADLKASDVWRPSLRPFLDEYVTCLRLAREHRELAEKAKQVIPHRDAEPEILTGGVERNRESGLTHAHAMFASSLKYVAEARSLAELLGLTPKARQALATKAEETPEEPDAFAQADELSRARSRKAANA